MKRLIAAIMILGMLIGPAGASEVRKLAIVSAIGDSLTIVTYRLSTGTQLGRNYIETVKLPSPAFDNAALKVAAQISKERFPGAATLLLSMRIGQSDAGQEPIVDNGQLPATSPLLPTLRKEGATHLLVISKHRATARLKLFDTAVGTGTLEGLGFYIDRDLPTVSSDTNERGTGFIAPFAYLMLSLVDLASLTVAREAPVTASASWSAGRNREGVDPWGAMTADQKTGALMSLIQSGIAEALPGVYEPR